MDWYARGRGGGGGVTESGAASKYAHSVALVALWLLMVLRCLSMVAISLSSWRYDRTYDLCMLVFQVADDSQKPVDILQQPYGLTTADGIPETLGGLVTAMIGAAPLLRVRPAITHPLRYSTMPV